MSRQATSQNQRTIFSLVLAIESTFHPKLCSCSCMPFDCLSYRVEGLEEDCPGFATSCLPSEPMCLETLGDRCLRYWSEKTTWFSSLCGLDQLKEQQCRCACTSIVCSVIHHLFEGQLRILQCAAVLAVMFRVLGSQFILLQCATVSAVYSIIHFWQKRKLRLM